MSPSTIFYLSVAMLLGLVLSPSTGFSQVGIGQPSPQGALHITPVTQQAIIIDPAPSGTGEIVLRELSTNGTNHVSLKAPDNISNDVSLTLPSTNGTNGQVLATDGSGNLSFKNSGGSGTGSGAPGIGTDMFTQYIHQTLDLWTPHGDNCNSVTEVFVEMGTTGVGYCMEKNERSATAFEGALETCMDAGKRLPEPAEWKYACNKVGTSLSNMVDDWEWSSNFTTFEAHGSGTSHGIGAASAGNGSCSYLAWHWVGETSSGAEAFLPYRCVR